jgi:hypothetical protein
LDGFPSSQFSQLNSLKRNTLETAFSFFKLPLKFYDQRRKSKRARHREKPGANRRRAPLGRSDRAVRPTLLRGPVQSGFPCTPFISHFQPVRKGWPSKTSRETPEK